MNNSKITAILWRSLHSGLFYDNEKLEFIEHFNMPDKGYGVIQVPADKVELSISLLKDFVGQEEFHYYVDGFISHIDEPVYYGKFEIEKLYDFINLLLKNDIKITNILFSEEYFLI